VLDGDSSASDGGYEDEDKDNEEEDRDATGDED
jgi:hypothetical protein